MSKIDPSDEIAKLHSQVKDLLAKKYDNEAIISKLRDQGLEPYYIQTVIENVKNEKDDKKSFRNSMIMGIFYILAGTIINVLSYTIAENANSSFFYLFWGIVVLGIVTIVRGFILYKR